MKYAGSEAAKMGHIVGDALEHLNGITHAFDNALCFVDCTIIGSRIIRYITQYMCTKRSGYTSCGTLILPKVHQKKYK